MDEKVRQSMIYKNMIVPIQESDNSKLISHYNNQIDTILMHLLKISAQMERYTGEWSNTIYRTIKEFKNIYNENTNVQNGVLDRDIMKQDSKFIISSASKETNIEIKKLIPKYIEMIAKLGSIEKVIDPLSVKDYIDNVITKHETLPDDKKKEFIETNHLKYTIHFGNI